MLSCQDKNQNQEDMAEEEGKIEEFEKMVIQSFQI